MRTLVRLSVIVLSFALAAGSLPAARAECTHPLFATPGEAYDIGDNPSMLATGDLDGDGDLDMVAGNTESNDVSVLLNYGDGTFSEDTRYPSGDPRGVALGDLDGDGDLDLVVANWSMDDICILFNNGNGTFEDCVTYAVGNSPVRVKLGDLNGDDDLDIVVVNHYGGSISVLLNNGNGTFLPQVSYSTGSGVSYIALGDLDDDGDLDAVVSNCFSGDVRVHLNDGNGVFTQLAIHSIGWALDVALGDVDADGDLDIVALTYDEMWVLLNNGDAEFTPEAPYNVDNTASEVALGDLNGDGHLDAAVTIRETGNVSVFLNQGDGTFAPPWLYPVGDYPYGIAMGDMDADGDLDLAVVNPGSDDVVVLLNVCVFQIPYDFDYRCVIVAEPSTVDQTTEMPSGLSIVPVGETFYVEFWATDSGTTNTGLVSAYTDMDYPEDLVSDCAPGHTPLFSLFHDGVCDGSIVDELGGSQLEPDIGVEPEWARVGYVGYSAVDTGTAEFLLGPATTESSAHGRGLVPTSLIDYGTCTVEIVCSCIYDLDDNCNIAGGDLGLFAPCWGCCDDEPCWDEYGCSDKDFDCNGCVSGGDLAWFAGSWGKTCDQIDPIADYPPCRQCNPPIVCPLSTRGTAPERGASKRDADGSDGNVELMLRLRLDPHQRGTLTRPGEAGRIVIHAGDRVSAEVRVMDTSTASQGLTAVFTDLYFDTSKFEILSVNPTATFALFVEQDFDIDKGIVRRVGGATMEPGHGVNAWTTVSVVELRALVNVAGLNVTIRPSQNEAVSRRGQGLVSTDQISILPSQFVNGKHPRTLGEGRVINGDDSK